MARPNFNSNGKQEEELPKAKINRGNLKEAMDLLRFAKPYRGYFIGGLIFLFLSNLATMSFPFATGKLIDTALLEGKGTGPFANINDLSLFLMGVLAFQLVFYFCRIYLFALTGEMTLADMRRETYGRIISLPMSFFSNRRVGELASRLSSDLSQIQDTITNTLAEFLRQIMVLLIGMTLIFSISTKLALVMLSVFPVVIVAAVLFGKVIRKLSKKAQDQLAESATIVEETLQGITNVKAFTNEGYETNRYRTTLDKVVSIALKSAKYRGAFASFLIVSMFGAIVLVMWYGSVLIQSHELTVGQLISFIIYTTFVAGSMAGFAEVYSQLQKTIGATQRVRELIWEVPEQIDTKNATVTPENKIIGEVEFSHLAFSYPSRQEIEVLKDISFTIKQGQKIAIVGPSGAGKSTIAGLLLQFYQPSAGQISFDRKPAVAFQLTQLRKQMAYVPQDVILFGGTIHENIAYGKPDATTEEIIAAAQKANAHSFIESFPEKYETIVGERGIKLSGGQRQRIAIARAVLKNPAILILDEATSSLDSESEKLVQEALEELMKNRTSFIIAHRLSTIRNADKILVLDKGIISEAGTHDELMQIENGLYRKLSELQFETRSIEEVVAVSSL